MAPPFGAARWRERCGLFLLCLAGLKAGDFPERELRVVLHG